MQAPCTRQRVSSCDRTGLIYNSDDKTEMSSTRTIHGSNQRLLLPTSMCNYSSYLQTNVDLYAICLTCEGTLPDIFSSTTSEFAAAGAPQVFEEAARVLASDSLVGAQSHDYDHG
jgi:hypothetical protein